MALKVGDKAPGFTLPDAEKRERSLNEFLGKKTVLAFIPGAFTGVCTKELCQFRDSLAKLNGMNAQIVAIDVDAPFSNRAYAAANNLTFPVLSDHTRATSIAYGGIHENFSGIKGYSASKRAVYVLDKNGIVRYAWVTEIPGVEPAYEEIYRVLASF